jgi:hypothetical protein
VHIEQHQNHEPYPLRTTPSRYYRPAAEDYVAVFPTRLALARWTRGGDIPHVFSSARHAPMRAAWYAHAQRQFQAWLEAGGFHADSHAE